VTFSKRKWIEIVEEDKKEQQASANAKKSPCSGSRPESLRYSNKNAENFHVYAILVRTMGTTW